MNPFGAPHRPAAGRHHRAGLLLAMGLAGCGPGTSSHSPAIDVLGSYFPAWLLCIVVGIGLTIITRLLFTTWKVNSRLLFAPLVYPCLIAIFAMTIWLLFFRN
ncbi:MAG: YtcA family lipoprotein [Chthoniobacter sp.]